MSSPRAASRFCKPVLLKHFSYLFLKRLKFLFAQGKLLKELFKLLRLTCLSSPALLFLRCHSISRFVFRVSRPGNCAPTVIVYL